MTLLTHPIAGGVDRIFPCEFTVPNTYLYSDKHGERAPSRWHELYLLNFGYAQLCPKADDGPGKGVILIAGHEKGQEKVIKAMEQAW